MQSALGTTHRTKTNKKKKQKKNTTQKKKKKKDEQHGPKTICQCSSLYLYIWVLENIIETNVNYHNYK